MNGATEALNQVVDEQIRVAEAVLEILELENKALQAGNIDSLNLAGEKKSGLVITMEQLELERELIVQSGDTVEAGHRQRWDHLLDLMSECKNRNERNGELVRSRRQHVARALKVLHGEALELYDASGLAAGSSSALNDLGEA
jgi:flagellar biosynthesis/type III secretory pathway chaperone